MYETCSLLNPLQQKPSDVYSEGWSLRVMYTVLRIAPLRPLVGTTTGAPCDLPRVHEESFGLARFLLLPCYEIKVKVKLIAVTWGITVIVGMVSWCRVPLGRTWHRWRLESW